jgi:hypothetical protein
MFLNLILAVFWVVIGTALFMWKWFDPQAPDFRIGWLGGISLGWVAVFLALYNVVRWAAVYYASKRRVAHQATGQIPKRRRSTPLDRERNPDFDFNDPRPEDQGSRPQ